MLAVACELQAYGYAGEFDEIKQTMKEAANGEYKGEHNSTFSTPYQRFSANT